MNHPTGSRGIRRIIYFVLAGLFLLFGLIGVVLPGIPTTPFLLLMSYFLIRASPKLHALTLQVPIIGPAIRDWDQQRAVRSRTKLVAYAMVLVVLGLSLLSRQTTFSLKILITSLAITGMFVVWRLPHVR